MLSVRNPTSAIYVDRASQQWVVRDPEGNYWALPFGEEPWENREPYEPTPAAELEFIPGHYKYLLQLPF